MSSTRNAQQIASTERVRRSRARKKLGFMTVPVDVHHSEADKLVQLGLLKPGERLDRYALEEALGAFLSSRLGNA